MKNSQTTFAFALTCAFYAFFMIGCESNTDPKKAHREQAETRENSIVTLSPDDIKPAFSRDTVIKLNTIVSKQLDVISAFDTAKKRYQNNEHISEKEKADYQDVISNLWQQAKTNKNALVDAKHQLDQSGEQYNKPTLAGMLSFVKEVEQEISNHYSELLKLS